MVSSDRHIGPILVKDILVDYAKHVNERKKAKRHFLVIVVQNQNKKTVISILDRGTSTFSAGVPAVFLAAAS